MLFIMLTPVLCVLLQSAVLARPPDRNAPHAVQLEQEGKIEEALEEYERYLAEHPNDVSVARRFLGLLYRQQMFDRLITVYADLHPSLRAQRDLTALVGRAYVNLGEKDEGIKVFLSIISREGGTEQSYRYVGNTLLSLGYVDAAQGVFERGRKQWGERSFARELYHCYVRVQDSQGAFRELLHLYLEEEASTEWIKRELITLVGKDETLLRYLESIARSNAEYTALAGELFLERGEIEMAKEFLLPVLDVKSLLAFARLCMEKGHVPEAEEVLLLIMERDDGASVEEQAQLLLAGVYAETERMDDALKMLDVIIRDGTTFRDSAMVRKAKILLYDKHQYRESTELLEQLAERQRSLVQRDWFLALLYTGYLRMGDLSGAEELVSASITPLSFFFSGEVLFFKGSYDQAREKYKSAVARGLDRDFANDALERIMLMELLKAKPVLLALVRDIELEIARASFERAIERINEGFDASSEKGALAVLLYCKARAHAHQGLTNEAISSYLNVADEAPESSLAPKALFHAAMLYRDGIGDHALASALLRRIVFDYPESVEAELARRELQVL